MSEQPEDVEPTPEPPIESRSVASPSPLIGRVVDLIAEAEQALAALLAHGQAADKKPTPDASSRTDAEGPDARTSTTELIHDYRVALRRLRSVLRPLELGYGKRKMRAFADALRTAAATTGDLRDEEVLRETLDDIDKKGLDPRRLTALRSWKAGRERRERGQRARVIRAIRDDSELDAGVRVTLTDIRKRLLTPRADAPDDRSLAAEALRRAFAKVHARLALAKAGEPESMHRLRIAIKQLRYTVELVRLDSPLDLGPVETMAVKLQKQLGKLHDLDEALIRMERARGLEPAARRSVLDELAHARHKHAARCERDTHGPLKKLLAVVVAANDG